MFSIRQIAILCILISSFTVFSQRMGIGTLTPHASALLDITSTNKGLLIPRMTTSQRLSIGASTTGLIVFDATTSGFWYTEMNDWTELTSRWKRNGEAIYILNSGNVGIGLTDPTAKLEVLGQIRAVNPGDSPDGSTLALSSPSTDPGIIMSRGNGSGSEARRWDLKIDNDNSFRILDQTAGQLRLMVNTAGRVSMGTAGPDASAALDVQSTTKGFLPPRLTLAQRVAMTSPAEGLLIWCSDCGLYGEVQIYNGFMWTNMIGETAVGAEVGDFHQGGIVAYVLQPGDPGYVAGELHGIIAAPSDLNLAAWGCYGTNLPGCEGTALGTGHQNTLDINSGCGDPGIAGRLCMQLVLNNYNDWFLPGKDELAKLYNNKDLIGGFVESIYWSSTEYNPQQAYGQDFSSGSLVFAPKSGAYGVRAIRYF